MKSSKLYQLILSELLNIAHPITANILQAQVQQLAKASGCTYETTSAQLKRDACLALADKLSQF